MLFSLPTDCSVRPLVDFTSSPASFSWIGNKATSNRLTGKELEMKKKTEEETKEKNLDSDSAEAGQDPDLVQVKKRLDALEESVKEIVDKTRKTLPQKGEDQSSSKLETVAPPDRNIKSSSAAANSQTGSSANSQTGSSSTESKVSVSTSVPAQKSVVKSPPVISVDKDEQRGKSSDKNEKR
ncbi:hypothetical protein EJ110_NYTH16799 [Nymphaea thermarum]|nr:hypothetical protein EJ110_NYTH16799 [Nymphaea thermarum]